MMKIIFLVLFMLSLSACVVNHDQSTKQSLIFTERESGQTVSVKLGDVITIKLDENPTTGFLWDVEKNDVLSKVFDKYTPSSSSRSVVGSGGVRTLKFRVTVKASTTLKLKYWRGWEGDASITQRFEIKVIVI